jgi:hypothetical protein
MEDLKRHYSEPLVRREIAAYARGRWVGIHCTSTSGTGRPLLIRYLRRRHPLRISSEEDAVRLFQLFERLGPRAFYGTANLYARLEAAEDVADLGNVVGCTPTWDVDNVPEAWKATIAAVKEIVSFLDSEGVRRSVYVKWSGRGCHVHLHERAFSKEVLRRFSAFDIGYAVVEYVNSRLAERLLRIAGEYAENALRVDNEMDVQRLFTCPLSLHKELDRVCVCIAVEDLDRFTPEWTAVGAYRHYEGWNRWEEGEGDSIAVKACAAIGPSPSRPRLRLRRHRPLGEQIDHWTRVKLE